MERVSRIVTSNGRGPGGATRSRSTVTFRPRRSTPPKGSLPLFVTEARDRSLGRHDDEARQGRTFGRGDDHPQEPAPLQDAVAQGGWASLRRGLLGRPRIRTCRLRLTSAELGPGARRQQERRPAARAGPAAGCSAGPATLQPNPHSKLPPDRTKRGPGGPVCRPGVMVGGLRPVHYRVPGPHSRGREHSPSGRVGQTRCERMGHGNRGTRLSVGSPCEPARSRPRPRDGRGARPGSGSL